MQLVIRAVLLLAVALFLLPERSAASIIFKAGKTNYVAPGEEEMSGDASQLYQIGQNAEKSGDKKRAIKAYKSLVKRHPKDALAPRSCWKSSGQFQSTNGNAPNQPTACRIPCSDARFPSRIDYQ